MAPSWPPPRLGAGRASSTGCGMVRAGGCAGEDRRAIATGGRGAVRCRAGSLRATRRFHPRRTSRRRAHRARVRACAAFDCGLGAAGTAAGGGCVLGGRAGDGAGMLAGLWVMEVELLARSASESSCCTGAARGRPPSSSPAGLSGRTAGDVGGVCRLFREANSQSCELEVESLRSVVGALSCEKAGGEGWTP